MKLTTALVTGALALSLLAQPAFAETVTRSIVVQTADLDLASPQGRATLDQRVKVAAEKVCAPTPLRPLQEMRDYDRCLDGAFASAQRRKVQLIAASGGSRTLARR